MNVLLIDGHPDADRLSAHLLDVYQAALPAGTQVTRMAVRDLDFDPNLRRGYAEIQPLEPDLLRVQQALADCDHLVLAYPLWWGAEPALLKGFFDRIILPGYAFSYHKKGPFWNRLMAGRSADLIVTGDTYGWYLRWAWGNTLVRRMRHQVLGFVGIKPLRVIYLSDVRRGGAERNLPGWRARLERAARSAASLRRPKRNVPQISVNPAPATAPVESPAA